MKHLPPIWTAFTSTDNKSWSFARTSTGALLAASIAWGSYIVWYKMQIPDFTSVALLFGALYGINRGAEAYENRPQQPAQPPQPSQPVQTVTVNP